MTTTAFVNGEFLATSEACIHIDDGGWLHGAGLFETMRAEHGRVFRLASHLERLRRSADTLLATIEPDRLPDASVISELLRRNDLISARVRLTVSAGRMVESENDESTRITVCLTASPLAPYADRHYDTGVQVSICRSQVSPTDPTAGHKTTGYLPRLLGLRQAREAGCFESLWFTTANRLAEGSISNVFLVKDGVLKTPPLDTPVLPGIARGVVIDLAKTEEIELAENPLTIDDLLDADEAFLTNAIIQIMPVVQVEKREIADGKVGAVTGKLLEGYRSLVREECRP